MSSAQARFRLDLYERLNVLRIDIPPLRERPEDIELQATYFLERYQPGRRKLRGFSPEALDVLRRRTWGGNPRQLENMVLSVIAERPSGPLVELQDLPAWARSFAQPLVTGAGNCETMDGHVVEGAVGMVLVSKWDELFRIGGSKLTFLTRSRQQVTVAVPEQARHVFAMMDDTGKQNIRRVRPGIDKGTGRGHNTKASAPS